jgi:adenosylcobyric acid synthase
MTAKTIMVQGTASSVGKSVLVAALCRIFKQDGYKVAPFKAQNMSNNSFVTKDGGEIGRAQAVQAEAAGVDCSVLMNPILLKPEADNKSQVVVMGKVDRTLDAKNYYAYTAKLRGIVRDSLNMLMNDYQVVVMEGAGSPAEINLRDTEIVNMRVAKMANSPVLLVGDIDRGGVFASLVGTLQLLDEDERKLIKGFIINKFRGDLALLKPGLDMLEKISSVPVLGVIPYFNDIAIAQEDAVFLEENASGKSGSGLVVAVLRLPRISNYDDFDPLQELGCNVVFVEESTQLGNADMIIIPGTKNTIQDLHYIEKKGIAQALLKKAQEGTPVLGVCGGYQMLGKGINDPSNVESRESYSPGLGLLEIETTFSLDKTTVQVKAKSLVKQGIFASLNGLEMNGYEIHSGMTNNRGYQPFSEVRGSSKATDYHLDGAINDSGTVMGTYLHGIFHNKEFAAAFVDSLRKAKNLPATGGQILDRQGQYDKLATLARSSLDMAKIYSFMEGK